MEKKEIENLLKEKLENGQHISPILPKGIKNYLIDIDGTICDTVNSDYLSSQPKKDIIEKFNKLYDDGYEVHYWTARGAISKKNWDYWTKRQLEGWGVKYTSINMDKPHYDYWIDDKSINIKDI